MSVLYDVKFQLKTQELFLTKESQSRYSALWETSNEEAPSNR